MATNNNIRSKYIKQIMEDAQDVNRAMTEAARETFRSILDESLSKNIRQVIAEGDEYSVDEIDAPKPEVGNENDEEPKAEETDGASADEAPKEGGEKTEEPAEDGSVEASADDDNDGDEFWNEFDSLKGDDGTYDLTKADNDTVVKVFQQLSPDDGVLVTKKDDNTLELSDQETDKTYIIDLGADTEGDGVSESNGNTGYTDNYQSQSAMTTPPNKEVANPSTTYSMDGGVPEGDAKPFAGTGDKAPFDKKVNEEEDDFNLELSDETVSETMTTQEHGAYNRGTGMVHTNSNDKASKGRNSHAEGEQVHTTMQNSYSEAQVRKLKQIQEMANKTFNENKQLKKELGRLVGELKECVLINHNMGNIVRIIMEHSTTTAEKHDIARRFAEARTKEQSNALFKTINEELKRRPVTKLEPQVVVVESKSETVSESRQPMYQSNEMKDFMARMDNVYRRK